VKESTHVHHHSGYAPAPSSPAQLLITVNIRSATQLDKHFLAYITTE